MTKRNEEPARTPHVHSVASEPVKVEIDLTATEAAWKKHEARARALPAAEVSAARVDVTAAAAIAISATENVLAQRDALKKAFRDPPIDVFERVREVALAAQHADLVHRAAQDESSSFADILPRMVELRGLLLDDLDIQVKRGKADGSAVAAIRAGDNTPRDFANDLNDAATWYRAHWDAVGRTTVSREEVAEASALATKALARIGAKVVADASKANSMSTGELRRRAFTLLELDYEVVRRYGSFLYWDAPGGWEQYFPSLWAGRVTSRAEKSDEAPAGPVNPDAKPA